MPLSSRRTLRLPCYDYTRAGAYFVTFCTHQRAAFLGQVDAGTTTLSIYGQEVARWYETLESRFPSVRTGDYVVMPNHVHAILWLDEERTGQAPSLQAVVGAWKSLSGRAINIQRDTRGYPVWQRGFYDHVVRSEEALYRIQAYINENPAAWEQDRFFTPA